MGDKQIKADLQHNKAFLKKIEHFAGTLDTEERALFKSLLVETAPETLVISADTRAQFQKMLKDAVMCW